MKNKNKKYKLAKHWLRNLITSIVKGLLFLTTATAICVFLLIGLMDSAIAYDESITEEKQYFLNN